MNELNTLEVHGLINELEYEAKQHLENAQKATSVDNFLVDMGNHFNALLGASLLKQKLNSYYMDQYSALSEAAYEGDETMFEEDLETLKRRLARQKKNKARITELLEQEE